ncbi:FAD-dependent oxidoreductase [Variovorax sp. RHLX14]|uniref:FAD-dependent oxidoreductase n=1 Tax=Variovorax sp. RHLX14 TaxID=1259731 RepID=UPI003F46C146
MKASRLENCDLLIVGAGPAGMAAAVAAAPSGANIVIVDDNPSPGGQIWRGGPGVTPVLQAQKLRDELARCGNVRIVGGARVAAAPAPGLMLLEDARRGWLLRYAKLILSTGARELLLPFPGWTLPGVTGAGGLQALVKSGMPVAGERIVIAGSGPLLFAAASTASKAGAHVVRIAEQASLAALAGFATQLGRWPAKAAQALALYRPSYRWASHVLSATGDGKVESVRLKRGLSSFEDIECDRVAVGFGLRPNTELGQLVGCRTAQVHGAPALAVDRRQRTGVPGVYAAGECTGVGGSERALVQGAMAGCDAVGLAAAADAMWPDLARWDAFAEQLHRSFALPDHLRSLSEPDTIVCRCEDVAHGDLVSRNGWIDAKLHTRCGMGACQGRICGAATQFLFGWSPPEPRPPLFPVRVSTLAVPMPSQIPPDRTHGH